ncbi:hypothetical protein RF55_21246 [Lasius niger]|uniref:Uncharacterized protein n=1 Tax=Lasius niger TaxID=67767 RepID=A0A0J7JYM5_LASNI|nr:hypothetical protein RF55_21246 [Lasius niger]
MALVPPELVSEYFQINKPEIRLEENILNLLQQNDVPDDLRAKLLSQLITKYQRAMQPAPPPKPFEIPPELLAPPPPLPSPPVELTTPYSRDALLAKFIGYAVPKTFKKFILPILERLSYANYTFNDKNEFQVGDKPEYRSNAIDLFSYLMKDIRKNEPPPVGFEAFFKALFKINIPRQWIGNKRLREVFDYAELDPLRKGRRSVTPSPEKPDWEELSE